MALDKVTVTAVNGPAVTATSKVFNNIKGIEFKFDSQVVSIRDENNTIHDFDLYGTTTVTYTVATHTATVVVSQ